VLFAGPYGVALILYAVPVLIGATLFHVHIHFEGTGLNHVGATMIGVSQMIGTQEHVTIQLTTGFVVYVAQSGKLYDRGMEKAVRG